MRAVSWSPGAPSHERLLTSTSREPHPPSPSCASSAHRPRGRDRDGPSPHDGRSPPPRGFDGGCRALPLAPFGRTVVVQRHVAVGRRLARRPSPGWWAVTTALHLPFARDPAASSSPASSSDSATTGAGGRPEPPGRLPAAYPTVCVQLPMFNEHAVARRVIEAASAMTWPADRLSVQVLDDSTDEDTRALVDARLRRRAGVDRRRLPRAAARRSPGLQGRRPRGRPPGDRRRVPRHLRRRLPAAPGLPAAHDPALLPRRRRARRRPRPRAGAVGPPQPRRVSADARAVALGRRPPHAADVVALGDVAVRELHRHRRRLASRRRSRPPAAGARRASSRTASSAFATCSPATARSSSRRSSRPPSCPATYTAYKAQQKRWTQGWVQLQRLHLRTLLFGFPLLRGSGGSHLAYHMCISWQWPLWAIWMTHAAAPDLHRPVVRRARARRRRRAVPAADVAVGCRGHDDRVARDQAHLPRASSRARRSADASRASCRTSSSTPACSRTSSAPSPKASSARCTASSSAPRRPRPSPARHGRAGEAPTSRTPSRSTGPTFWPRRSSSPTSSPGRCSSSPTASTSAAIGATYVGRLRRVPRATSTATTPARSASSSTAGQPT